MNVLTEPKTKCIDEQIKGLLDELSKKEINRIKEVINRDKFKSFRVGRFSFFDDVLTLVDYGFVINEEGQIQTYSQETCPCLAIDPIKTPTSLSEYKRRYESLHMGILYSLQDFPNIQFFKDRVSKII